MKRKIGPTHQHEIRRLRRQGLSFMAIAKMYDVTVTTIRDAVMDPLRAGSQRRADTSFESVYRTMQRRSQ